MASTRQIWPQIFCQTVTSNCRYWLQRAHNDISSVVTETSQVLRGLSYSLSLPEAWGPTRDLMLCLSPLIIRQGQGTTWESFLTRGIARSTEEKDPAEIDLRLQLGHLYRLQGRLPEAQHCFQNALDLCDQYQARTHYWTLVNQLGLVARLSAQHEKALAYCRQVLTEQSLPIAERAEALNVMGLVAYDRRQWAKALDSFDQALTLYRSLADAYQMARILNNRGLALLRDGRLDEAGDSYQEAVQQFRTVGDQVEIFKAVMNLGNVFLMKQAYEAAIGQYQEALPVFRQCNYLIDLANVYNNLGMASTGLADWQAAEAYFSASLEISRNFEDPWYQVNTLDNFGDMLIQAGRPQQAQRVLSQALETLTNGSVALANSSLQQGIEDRLAQLKKVGSIDPTNDC